jgi:AraC-like DNA-binding protein
MERAFPRPCVCTASKRACDCIVHANLPLAVVADSCGFADQSHMTRQFSGWIGVSPGELRRRRRDITSVQDPHMRDDVY